MARSADFWDRCLGVFDPGEVLVGQRSQALYCEREHSPFDELLNHFRPTAQPTRPPRAFFTGHRGSGKSSLLLRLLEHLTSEYFVVYFDIDHNLDSRTANQIDLLYLLGATIYQVASNEGIGIRSESLNELARSVYTMTYETKEVENEALNVGELAKELVCFGASMLGAEVGRQLAEAALKPFTFTSGVSEEVAGKRQVEPQVQNIINNVNLIISEVQQKAQKNLLVVVDGLDKLQRIEQAELIFLQSRALLGPVCRIIYTVPMLVFTSLGFGQTEGETKSHLLPNVKLFDRTSDTQTDPKGYDILREVVAKRMKSIGQTPDTVFEPEALDLLIFKSGGVVRDFIWLAQDAMSAAKILELDKVNTDAAQKAINDRASQLAFRLTETRVEELQKVRENKRPSGSPESRELLHGLFIVAYRNQTTWFDAHPLLWEELSET